MQRRDGDSDKDTHSKLRVSWPDSSRSVLLPQGLFLPICFIPNPHFKLQGWGTRAQTGQDWVKAVHPSAKVRAFSHGEWADLQRFGCAMTSIFVFLYLKLPMPALGLAVLVIKNKRQKKGRNISCVAGSEGEKRSTVNKGFSGCGM